MSFFTKLAAYDTIKSLLESTKELASNDIFPVFPEVNSVNLVSNFMKELFLFSFKIADLNSSNLYIAVASKPNASPDISAPLELDLGDEPRGFRFPSYEGAISC